MGSAAVGYAFVLTSVLFFGSNFVVTKKYKSGDGFYFQWVMCSAILIAGLIVRTTWVSQFQSFTHFSQPWRLRHRPTATSVPVQHFIVLCNTTDDDLGNKSCPPFEPFAMLVRFAWTTELAARLHVP